jgi:hypothetical protein
MKIKSKLSLDFIFKTLIYTFLLSVFSYVYYFSLNNIINYWTYSEIHINYNLGFAKRGFLGSIMLYLESIGLEKKFFFSTIFYLFSILNILLFLKLLRRYHDENIFFFAFFALNPSLILFSFYDLGGYARFEIFGIFACLLHAFFLQKLNYSKLTYNKYLRYVFLIISPICFVSVLIQEVNILFFSFHFFSFLRVLYLNKFQYFFKFKFIIFLNFIIFLMIIYLLFTYPFTKDFAVKLYNTIPNKDGTSFWIWESISNSIDNRLNIEIYEMLNPKGAIQLYLLIFIFFLLPILLILHMTTSQNKLALFISILSIAPIFILFFIGRDWGRWFHIILMLIFFSYIQFNKKKIIPINNIFSKILSFVFIILIVFQFFFTRIPHCCNLVRLNLDMYGGIIPKIIVFTKIINNKIDIEERFKSF